MSLRVTRRLASGAWHRTRALALAAVVAISGCATSRSHTVAGPFRSETRVPVVKANENQDRMIRAGYHLRISVIVQDKIEVALEDERVSEGGELLLPLIRQVRLADMTMNEAADHLTALYSKYYREPHVYLEYLPVPDGEQAASTSSSGYVAVTGRVKNPGLVAVPSTLDLKVSEAILKAGGLNTSAKDRAVQVTRRRPDGGIERRTVNLRAILSEGDLAADLALQGGDVIYVPESLF